MPRAMRGEPRLDPFKVLGISPLASQAEITAAYRALAKKYHPDRFADRSERARQAAQRRMQLLNEAYKLARETPKKATQGSWNGGPAGGAGVWFGTAPGTWARTARRPGQDPKAREAELRKAREGAERAAREHEAQARAFQRLRADARQSARYGNAVPRPKRRGLERSSGAMSGLGQALVTNQIPCHGCRSIQRLPPNFQAQLGDTNFHCSNCGRVILSR